MGKREKRDGRKAKKMRKNGHVKAKVTFVAALALIACISIPFSALAFRNPDRDPQQSLQTQDIPPAVHTTDSDALAAFDSADDADNSGSGNSAAAVLDAGEISPTSEQGATLSEACGFAAFNERQQLRWQATFSATTGTVRRLYGAVSEPLGGSPEDGARAFLQESHTLFGLHADLSGIATESVSRSRRQQHVRFQQTYNGTPVLGAQIIVHSGRKGRITMVQNSCLTDISPANRDVLSMEDAREIAEADLRSTLGPRAVLSNVAAEKLLVPEDGTHRYAWKITTNTRKPEGLWVCRVDAESGDILYRGDEIRRVTKGRARVYRNNDEYWLGKIKGGKLDYLYEDKDGFLEGRLRGQHATIYDYADDLVFEPNLKFFYSPVTDKDFFDQAQAYYQMTTIWDWWQKYIINKYGPTNMYNFNTLSIPAIVNIDLFDEDDNETTAYLFCNAEYRSAAYNDPGLGWIPGFLFGDENTCGFFNEDFVVDADIVRHEYAHGIMDWAGFAGDDGQFGGDEDCYGRAMGEGNADWYAYLASGNPTIAYVTFAPYGLRNIDNVYSYPTDVDDPDYLTEDNSTGCPIGTALPAEHYTGQIWGGYLYELSRVLKKKALDFVYPSSFFFETAGGHRDGEADFIDAIRAQRDAELAMTGSNKQYFKAFGSMASRGFIRALPDADLYSHPCNYFGTEAAGEDSRAYLTLQAPLKIKTEANILRAGDQHEYPISASAGTLIVARVKAKKGGMKAPKIELFTIDGDLLNIVDFSGDPKVRRATMSYTVTETGTFVVRVTAMNSSNARGYYTMQLSAQ